MTSNNFNKVKKVLWLILIANLSVAALKIIVGTIIKSSSLTADGFHSLTDGSSNIVGLIGIHFASKPVDEEHPYGHSKFETLAGLFIAVMLFILGLRIISSAFSNMLHAIPTVPEVTIPSLAALLVTLAINIFVAGYEFKQGTLLNSTILISDSLHTRSDIFVSIGVLFTLVCVRLGFPPIIDSMASLIVSIFVLHAAYEIFSETSGVLVDQAVVSSEEIKNILMNFPQVKNVHKIRSRGCNHHIYIDLHLLVEPYMSIESSHKLMHEIEERLCFDLKKSVQAYIHLEPYYDKL
ncbi:MAG: putative cation efflux rotein [Clostridia bacterium]|jgi:cation diffusion facilitator family transporter|nr:putative cation efflux rotein [Clostridia bacterium]MDF2889874.1 putative cation efflux rotein [Clostridia bacterium]